MRCLAGNKGEEAQLGRSQQALLLGQAGLVHKGTSEDELRQWRMAPYVDAVLQQQRSRFLIRLSAQLLRCAALLWCLPLLGAPSSSAPAPRLEPFEIVCSSGHHCVSRAIF